MESEKNGEIKIEPLAKKDFLSLLEMEKEIYPEELVQGQAMVKDIENGNGLEYSMVSYGNGEKVGYLIAVENISATGEPTIYLEDIAVLPKAQRRGIAWEMLRELIFKLQTKAKKENRPIFWEMHLRETSQKLFEKHREELKKMGVEIVEEILMPGYYRNGESSLHRIYRVSRDS